MTHAELVEIGRKCLTKTCSVVITEIATSGEEPDVIGWRGPHTVLIECKTSRSDFLADFNKPWRNDNDAGIPGLGHARYYLCEPGVIKREELPPGWGLIHVVNGKTRMAHVAPHTFQTRNLQREAGILLSALRRLGQTSVAGISIKIYRSQTKCKSTITIETDEQEALMEKEHP
jgi:hypothetical protein